MANGSLKRQINTTEDEPAKKKFRPQGNTHATSAVHEKRGKSPEENGESSEQQQGTQWFHFLNPDHRALMSRYFVNVATLVKEREQGNHSVEKIEGALDTLINAIAHFIGEIWDLCVRLSKIRIDMSVHQEFSSLIQADMSRAYRLESFKARDRAQRELYAEKFTQAESSMENSSVLGQPSKSRKSKKGELTVSELATDEISRASSSHHQTQSTGVAPVSSARLFDSAEAEHIDPMTAAKQKAKESTLVQRKQAELNRQINVGDLLCGLKLIMSADEYLIPIPPRERHVFGILCSMYYEPFIELFAHMQAQLKHMQEQRRK